MSQRVHENFLFEQTIAHGLARIVELEAELARERSKPLKDLAEADITRAKAERDEAREQARQLRKALRAAADQLDGAGFDAFAARAHLAALDASREDGP